MEEITYTAVTSADDVTPELLEEAERLYDSFYGDREQLDVVDFIDRLDGMQLPDGARLDLGVSFTSPAIVKIMRHVRAYSRL